MRLLFVVVVLVNLILVVPQNHEPLEKQKSKKVFEDKNRYGGDMLGLVPKQKGVLRKAQTYSQRLWPDSTVYYQLAALSFSDPEKRFIENTMRYIESQTCIKFKPKTNQKDFINIIIGVGCYSYVGRVGGQQDLSLGNGFLWKGTVIHELMHALGFFHEHMRSDRDSYLKVYLNHVKPGMANNFEKNPSSMNRLLTKFDYNSIMIYSLTAFSKNGELTMEPKDKHFKLLEPYDKSKMSSLDAVSLNKMCSCPK